MKKTIQILLLILISNHSIAQIDLESIQREIIISGDTVGYISNIEVKNEPSYQANSYLYYYNIDVELLIKSAKKIKDEIQKEIQTKFPGYSVYLKYYNTYFSTGELLMLAAKKYKSATTTSLVTGLMGIAGTTVGVITGFPIFSYFGGGLILVGSLVAIIGNIQGDKYLYQAGRKLDMEQKRNN